MFRFNLKKTLGIAIAGLLLAISAGARANDAELISDANATKALFKRTDPGLAVFFERAPGYVIFPGIGKAGLGIGGAHGDGVVFSQGQPVGKASMTQISIGAQVGGQEFSEVIFFETPGALANFMKGKSSFSGQVSAVALKSGASANAKYTDGVAVFTATRGGLMLEAAVGGQKFSYEPFTVIRK